MFRPDADANGFVARETQRSEQPRMHFPRHTKHWCKTPRIVGFLDGHSIAPASVTKPFRHPERGRTRRRLAARIQTRIFIIPVSHPLAPWVLRDNLLRWFKGYMCCKLGDTSFCFIWIFANLKNFINTPLERVTEAPYITHIVTIPPYDFWII